MATILEGELTALAMCWRVERADGAGVGLTSHDAPVTSGGVTYVPSPGMVPAAVTKTLGAKPSNSEVDGALTSDLISERDLSLGRWNGAGLSLTVVDWEQPELQPVQLAAGELGEVSVEGDSFSAELRGASARLEAAVCPSTSPECRARFGDAQCRIDLAGRSLTAAVIGASDTALTLDRTVEERFRFGRLRYLRGENCGLSTTILAVGGSVATVRDIPRGSVVPGCLVELREGCDKRFATCSERFDNAANFRGEPHLPGNDLLTRYPGT